MPYSEYASPPIARISGTDPNVTTLFTIVGLPNRPSIAGSGGLYLIIPAFPSKLSSIAVSSPQTYEPPPI